MNFSLIKNSLSLTSIFFFIYACSASSLYENFKNDNIDLPVIKNYDDNKIKIVNLNKKNLNLDNKITLQGFKNKNLNTKKLVIKNSKIFILTYDLKISAFDKSNGSLISTTNINYEKNEDDIVTSFLYFEDSFIVALKSGTIIKSDIYGEILWIFKSKKILNTKISIFDDKIILLYSDEVKGISISDGSFRWSHTYDDIPVYQSIGGQYVNFINLFYFILPNNKIGSIDLNLGVKNNSNFVNMPLISNINNTNDKIHIYDNYLVYLDEGRQLYTYDIFINDFVIFNKNITKPFSSIFFNNSLIIKQGNYLWAINLINGKTFWLLNNEDLSDNSKIIGITNINEDILIFFDNGDILTINNKKIVNIDNFDQGKISSIFFDKENYILYLKNGKIVIY